MTNKPFHGPCTTIDNLLRFSTKLQIDRAEPESLSQRSQARHELLIEDPRQRQPSREKWRRLHGWDGSVRGELVLDAFHSEVLQAREQADEAEELFCAASRVSQREGPNGGLQNVTMLVQPVEELPNVEIPDVELLEVRERVQVRHRPG